VRGQGRWQDGGGDGGEGGADQEGVSGRGLSGVCAVRGRVEEDAGGVGVLGRGG
jgi:hypothetical protein